MSDWTSLVQIFAAQVVAVGLVKYFGGPPPPPPPPPPVLGALPKSAPHRALPRSKRKAR